jgi:hypothetical protein
MRFQFLFIPNWEERNALCSNDEEALICSGQKRGSRRLNPVWRQPYIKVTSYGHGYRTAITITVPSIYHSYPVITSSVDMVQQCLVTCLPAYSMQLLLEKLTCSKLVKKFPVFYWTQKFITAFISGQFWARSTQSMPLIPLLEDSS